MRRLSFGMFLLLLLLSNTSVAQSDSIYRGTRDINDYLRQLFSKKHKTDSVEVDNKKVAFSLLPAPVDANANTGLVVSFVSSFNLGEEGTDTKMSQVNFAPSFSFANQYVFPIKSYIYTNEDKYSFIGDYRFMIYPQPTYGLGTHNLAEEMSVLNYKQWRFYQFVTRKVSEQLRVGGGVLIDNYQNILEESEVDYPTDFDLYMKGNYSDVHSFGLAVQLLSDTRTNTINPEQGHYIELDYRFNFNGGVDNQSWQSVYIDLRKYHSFSPVRHQILAYRAFYWFTLNGDPHYLDLPSIGWDRDQRTGRGFTRNRYRSNSLLYFEGEYRTDLTRNGFLGAVFFSNLSTVSTLHKYNFPKWVPAVGTGLRLKWNKRNNANLALDFGVSKYDWSLRLGLTENF